MTQEPSRAYSKYVGTPYLDKGRTPSGWDCYGLYCWVLKERFGIAVPSYVEEYASAEADAEVAGALDHKLDAGWAAVPQGSEREGDGVVFLIAGQPRHCGYVVSPGMMLHSLRGRDTCIERYTSPQWVKRIEGFYRWNS